MKKSMKYLQHNTRCNIQQIKQVPVETLLFYSC